jgi:4-amino-4-deoxy-L-arabinose transferase-like glycosyltransferase
VPSDSALGSGEQGEVGEAFMRANTDRYHRVFLAGRMVVALCSALLLLVVWRWSRRLWGPRGALLSLAFLAFAPEALAHAGVVTLDVPTALGFTASLAAWQVFVTRGRWRDWAWAALAVAFTFNVRFTAVFLAPLLLALLVAQLATRRVRHPRRAFAGFGLLAIGTLVALQAGYLGRTSFAPLREWTFESRAFQGLQHALPWLRLPLPDSYVGGFDRQSVESQAHQTPSFLAGKVHAEAPLAYFPIALAVKWPVGFLGALLVLAAFAVKRRPPWRSLAWPLSQALLFLFIGMFIGRLGIGIRYLFPMVPALAVSLGALGSNGFAWRRAAIALAALQGIEAGAHSPWHLSFYNVLAGGPARGQWIVNDSNVDWGQGLIALRQELARRGITRIHLAYHGTTDPAVYGIDSVPYRGGSPGPESDWIAVSSYYFVGLSQRMMLREGRTAESLQLDFRPLWSRTPEAMPAGCMLLFKLR